MELAVEQTADFLVFWDATILMWRDCIVCKISNLIDESKVFGWKDYETTK